MRERHAATVVPVATWTVDPRRSTVGFKIRHLLIATVRGRFTDFEGTLEVGERGPLRACGTVRTATIDTGDPIRNERLSGPEFFDTATSSEMRFVSMSVEPVDGETLRIVGDLTIRDTTREVELRARRTAAVGERLELDVDGELSRSDFGIESAQLLEAGISDRVELALHVSLVKAG